MVVLFIQNILPCLTLLQSSSIWNVQATLNSRLISRQRRCSLACLCKSELKKSGRVYLRRRSRIPWAEEMREYAKKIRACLHGGGGPQLGEVTRLSILSLFLIWSRLHVRWGDPPHVTSPIWGPPPPCKQALIPWWMSCTFLKSICKKKHLSAEKQANVFKKFYEEVRLSRT